MVKWPFRRNSSTDDQPEYQVPAEIQDYYEAERRERTGVAWLMATGTLIVTILLAVGLFFGGRWIYRKVRGTDAQPAATTSNVENVEQAPRENEPSEPQTSSTNTERPSPAPSPSTPTPPAASSPTPTPPATSPSTPPATPPTSPAVAGSQREQDLPNTGPADVVAITAGATLLGTAGHYVVTRRSANRKH